MKKYIQQDYLRISHFRAKVWSHPVHNHNHFEIIYIHAGKGFHCVSNQCFSYTAGDLFLLSPCDHHHFDIREETTFTFLKFTNVYPRHVGNLQPGNRLYSNIDQLLFHATKNRTVIRLRPSDAPKAARIIELINEEWAETTNSTSMLVFSLMQSLFLLLNRNLPDTSVLKGADGKSRFAELVHFIHEHIYEQEKIRATTLAARFGYAKDYLGAFFKRETGTTLREYIRNYKIEVIKNRLTYSVLPIKSISMELGFTDLSHFNKYVRSLTGLNPTDYRRQLRNQS